jgi:hypothetical protein
MKIHKGTHMRHKERCGGMEKDNHQIAVEIKLPSSIAKTNPIIQSLYICVAMQINNFVSQITAKKIFFCAFK